MQGLGMIDGQVPPWRYVCKGWAQQRAEILNGGDLELAEELGIRSRVSYVVSTASRNFAPYLIGACDIYAAPARLEGFGMPQVEAGACAKPVIGTHAMGMLDTLVQGQTAFLAGVAEEIVVSEVILGDESGFEDKHKVEFKT